MKNLPKPIDLTRLKVFPLSERKSLSRLEEILCDPDAPPPACSAPNLEVIDDCAKRINAARKADAAVILMYGAHLMKNGAAPILGRLIERGWVTHLATNGAGTIHDWEFAFLGRSTESVKENVATGSFGTWDETGRNINLALLAGGLRREGYGAALGRFIVEEGTDLPTMESLAEAIRQEPAHPLTPARAELLQAMRVHALAPGRHTVKHPWAHASVLGQAFRHQVPMTVHPGIGYDIIANHPLFNGAAIGRAAGVDFGRIVTAIEGLDGGVVLSIGSAIMAPQVFEKSLSCVNNLRLQAGRAVVSGHSIYVVDLQDGGNWDWSRGEPPKTNPAYYLRFCKSFSRMGAVMHYACCDNVTFVHHLSKQLARL
jgi:hypothetical protein